MVQEHIYTANRSRIIGQSLWVWTFIALQIGSTLYCISLGLTNNRIGGLIFINVLLSLITIPAVIIFLKYYNYSLGKKFIVTYETLKFVDEKTGEVTELKNSDIQQINFVEATRSKLPWSEYEYFSFTDNNNKKIVIPFFILRLYEFQLDTLKRKVSNDNIIKENKWYPIF